MPLSAGYYFFYHEGGRTDKPPVLLLHGAGGDHLVWPAEIRRMPGFRVAALDLPGHGRSPGSGCQSVDDYARAVFQFMDETGFWQAVLIGHSMGGAVALCAAASNPRRIVGLGLVSSGPRLQVPGVILENVSNPSTYSFAAQSLHSLMCGPQTHPRLAEKNLGRLLSLRPTLLYGDLLACGGYDATEWLESIRVPVLVTCGTQDKLTPPRYSSMLAESIPGAALQTVDGAGHLVMLEQPLRVQKILSVFLHSLPYTPGA